MPVYLVERYTTTSGQKDLLADAVRLEKAIPPREGKGKIRFLRAIFVPAEELCFYLYEGASAEQLREAGERASVPVARIVEAVHLAPEEPTSRRSRTSG